MSILIRLVVWMIGRGLTRAGFRACAVGAELAVLVIVWAGVGVRIAVWMVFDFGLSSAV